VVQATAWKMQHYSDWIEDVASQCRQFNSDGMHEMHEMHDMNEMNEMNPSSLTLDAVRSTHSRFSHLICVPFVNIEGT
jgi:hypothetical protein